MRLEVQREDGILILSNLLGVLSVLLRIIGRFLDAKVRLLARIWSNLKEVLSWLSIVAVVPSIRSTIALRTKPRLNTYPSHDNKMKIREAPDQGLKICVPCLVLSGKRHQHHFQR